VTTPDDARRLADRVGPLVLCWDCRDSYGQHADGGGPCSCGCPAFRWVNPSGAIGGGYSSRPEPSAP